MCNTLTPFFYLDKNLKTKYVDKTKYKQDEKPLELVTLVTSKEMSDSILTITKIRAQEACKIFLNPKNIIGIQEESLKIV